jgi:cystathionine beta-synthase
LLVCPFSHNNNNNIQAPDSHISVARRLCDDTEHGHILDQYTNPSNPLAHYYGTAEEIIRQCGGPHSNIDMLVAGAGTGGTITGIAKRLKEVYPNIIVVGVDPVGSILAVPEALNHEHRLESYQVEGIGYDFIPDVLDRSTSLIDHWIKTNDHESLVMMRRLIRDEGLLCGGSSGAAVCAALRAAQHYQLNQKHHRIVIILPDSVRNYMTKALSDDWMSDHGYIDGDVIKAKTSYGQTWWSAKKVYELPINVPLTITSNVRCKDAITLLKKEGFDMVPVLDDNGHVIGVVTEGNITKCILSGRCSPDTTIADSGVIYKTFHKFTMNSTLGALANALDHDPFVLIVTEQRCFSFEKTSTNHNSSSSSKKRKIMTVSSSSSSTINDINITTTNDSIASIETMGSPDNNDEEEDDPNHHSHQKGEAKMMTRSVVSGIVSRIDLLDFIASSGHRDASS